MDTAASPSPNKRPLYWMALGTFAIGTEGFMISPLLPSMATDLSVSVAAAGQLVSAFALAYALSSPILTALTGDLNRRRLLIASLIAFALANVVAWASTGFWTLMGARVLLAFAAGLYVPSANAVAGALVPSEQRGRALAIITGGQSLAIALGVPLGAIFGAALGWRMTFVGVALLSAIAAAGLMFGLPRGFGSGLPTATLRQRLAVVSQSSVLLALLVTTLWATGAYTVYTYLATYLSAVAGLEGANLSIVLFVWGVAAATGVFLGGRLTDKFGSQQVMVPALVLLGVAFASLAVIADTSSKSAALIPALGAVVLWGVTAWGFFPAQQARLIGIAGVKVAPVVLSLNASFMFIGFSLGAALGALTLSHGSAGDLGWVGAACEIASVALLLATGRLGQQAVPAAQAA